MKAILIMGSTSDTPHAKKITDKLDEYKISWEQHAASAHKEPLKVLDILNSNKSNENIVYITIVRIVRYFNICASIKRTYILI